MLGYDEVTAIVVFRSVCQELFPKGPRTQIIGFYRRTYRDIWGLYRGLYRGI